MNESAGTYRAPPHPTRDEFNALVERVKRLENRKPREPLALRLWHTLLASVIALFASILSIGAVVDHVRPCATRDSVVGIFVVMIVISAIGAIVSMDSPRDLGREWRSR